MLQLVPGGLAVPGKPTEFSRLFDEYHGMVFRTAYRITGNAADAEDITSDSISDFVQTEPRMINWDRCFKKSPWLKDILESAREEELARLLCVSKRKIQSWSENGFLSLSFDPGRISDLFGDEPVYRFLDEYPELVDLSKCAAKSPNWFARYAKVQGRYRKKSTGTDSERYADSGSRYSLAFARH